MYEVLDNAIDEAQAGFASNVDIILHADGSVSITDNGRGVGDTLCLLSVLVICVLWNSSDPFLWNLEGSFQWKFSDILCCTADTNRHPSSHWKICTGNCSYGMGVQHLPFLVQGMIPRAP